jgi:hypothetical protein
MPTNTQIDIQTKMHKPPLLVLIHKLSNTLYFDCQAGTM